MRTGSSRLVLNLHLHSKHSVLIYILHHKSIKNENPIKTYGLALHPRRRKPIVLTKDDYLNVLSGDQGSGESGVILKTTVLDKPPWKQHWQGTRVWRGPKA